MAVTVIHPADYVGTAAERAAAAGLPAGCYWFEDDTGLVYRRTGAGTGWILVAAFTQPRIRVLSANFDAVAAGDYADNDVISNDATNGAGDPMEFSSASLVVGGALKIIGADLTAEEDGLLATSELFLFSQAPTASEMDDNAAWGGVGAADLPYYIGSISFPALADIGAGSYSKATSPTAAAPLLAYAVASSLFGILVLRDAEINETAGMNIQVRLYVE